MRRRWLVASGVVLAASVAAGEGLPPVESYTGSQRCGECHRGHYEAWRETYHATVITDSRHTAEGLLGDFGQEGLGFSPEEIEFAIGGHWYQRYVKKIEGELYVMPKVWSVASHRWETIDAWSWKKKPYGTYCIGCHTTRYDAEDGSYVEHAVGCEACHGPGREHAESRGTAFIANPARWSLDQKDLLCASCHVRGKDRTGRLMFAAGYVAGGDLAAVYSPVKVADGETARESFLRQFREWSSRLGEGPPPTCDTCGIDMGRKPEAPPTMNDYCLSCHRFGDDYASHTKHPSSLDLQCLDCHRRFDFPSDVARDVHSPSYFRVHTRTSYASGTGRGCRDCHDDLSMLDVARHLREWDHSDHRLRD